ncbi:eEF1-gamma domain-containing protein [Ascodesmis nigricans]|uniref:EEF1-gamma domain-containing protein n=1 Tax=Ascodesmis nigricans TaxID=341454 RepID=A0A4V3SIQ3_9PEZI|nr:eEF1-gamma domain-containing protein [Ascodesmis nigricans]
MSFGKIYSYANNPRTTALLAVAKDNNLDVEFVNEDITKGVSENYKKINPLGKVPTFVSANGQFILSECIAIAIYFAAQNEKTTLLGQTKEDYATILKWLSYANSEILPALGGWFRPLIGRDQYNKKNVDAAAEKTLKAVSVLESHLLNNTFLVGERLTLADYFAAGIISRGFEFVFDKEFRASHPNTTRWFELIRSQKNYAASADHFELRDEAIKYTPPKKEPKPAAPKKEAAPKPAKKEAEEEEEKPVEALRPKHPLEALGRSTLVLDDWKRKYSNEDTRSGALPWFWEHYKPEEYSLWKVDFKYNDELTLTFMSSNLIGGFFARLEASRKYLFGSMSVYGVNNDSIITGVFMARGQEAAPAFDVAPDWESYSFTKLDPTKTEDKAFVEDQWAWDKPIVVDGKTYDWADGKIFK